MLTSDYCSFGLRSIASSNLAMNTCVLFLFFIILLIHSSTSVIVPFSACPSEKCYTDLGEVFFKCAPHFFIGCAPQPVPCEGTSGYVCTKPAPIGTEITVGPGEPIVLEKVKLFTTYSFKVDLSALPLNTDFYLLSDATGSMGGAIGAVRTKFTDLVNFFKENSRSPRFGIGYYRDELEKGMVDGFKNAQALTEDIDKVEAAIRTLRASGGGDGDEANLVALYKVATDKSIGWRTDSRKILVYFGDFPGHEPTCIKGKTITRTDVVKALEAKKITVIAVSFGTPGLNRAPSRLRTCPGSGAAGTGQATAITTASGGGAVVSSTNQADLINRIKAAIQALERTFDLDASDCLGNLETSSTPALPVTIPGGSSKVIDQAVTILHGVCASRGAFSCDLKYTEEGADLGKVNLKVLEVEGC